MLRPQRQTLSRVDRQLHAGEPLSNQVFAFAGSRYRQTTHSMATLRNFVVREVETKERGITQIGQGNTIIYADPGPFAVLVLKLPNVLQSNSSTLFNDGSLRGYLTIPRPRIGHKQRLYRTKELRFQDVGGGSPITYYQGGSVKVLTVCGFMGQVRSKAAGLTFRLLNQICSWIW